MPTRHVMGRPPIAVDAVRTEQLKIRVTPAEFDAAERQALREHCSFSDLLRESLNAYVAQRSPRR